MQWMVPVASTEAQAWETLITALGLEGVSVGQHWTAPAGVPSSSGVAEYFNQGLYDALLRLEKPMAGVIALGTVDMGGQCRVGMNIYFYGDQAAEIAARDKPLWQAWIEERFPTPPKAGQVGATTSHHVDTH